MHLQQSSLITRKQLACISGGKKKCPNFLKLGTPFTYCGGRSYALKGNRVHHICVKEEMNLPFPSSNKEELVIHKYTPKRYDAKLPKEMQAMKDTPHVVPIFLEPKDQSTRNGADSGKGIAYVGHWKVTRVLKRRELYKDQLICARTYFQFDRFDEEFSKYIEHAHNKPISELITVENFDHMETQGDSDDDHSHDNEKSIDTVEKSVPPTLSLRRSTSGSINPQESIEASELLEEAQEEIKQEASDDDDSENDNNDETKSIDSVEECVPTTLTFTSTSTSVSRNPQESPEASQVLEETQDEVKQEEVKQEAIDGDYSNNEDGEVGDSFDTGEEPIPFPQVAVNTTHASTTVSRSDQKASDTSESNLPDQDVICIDSSNDEEDAKQLSGEEDDDDSIIEDVTSTQPNLKREPDFEEEYFLVRCDGDTSDKMVHIAKKQKTTWLNIRNAVNAQVDPRCGSYNFHIPHRNLDICQRQELSEVKQYMKGGSGTFDDPYQKIVIKKSK